MASLSLDPNTTPLSLNPSGAPPYFINPRSQAPTVLGTGILLIMLSTFCVITRLYTSFKTMKRLHLDDSVFGLVGAVAYWGIIYSLAADGWGRHSWDVPVSFLSSSYTNRQFASQILISPVKFVITSAIIILYMRIFGTLEWVRVVSYCLSVFLFLIQVQNIGIALYWYIPRSGDANNVMASLLRTEKTASSAIVNATCSTVVDRVFFIVPLIIVPSLNMTRQKKRAIFVVFVFGVLLNKRSISGQNQSSSLHSTKSLVGSSKDIIIQMTDCEPGHSSHMSPHSNSGKQERGNPLRMS